MHLSVSLPGAAVVSLSRPLRSPGAGFFVYGLRLDCRMIWQAKQNNRAHTRTMRVLRLLRKHSSRAEFG